MLLYQLVLVGKIEILISLLVFISKMGFDLFITLKLHMCDGTGKPYYYDKDFSKNYDISAIVVPEHLRKYLQQRGKYLHAYTDKFNREDRFDVDIDEFLEEFPLWQQVVADEAYDKYECYYYWDEEDHKKFKELLDWCSQQRCYFSLDWSY